MAHQKTHLKVEEECLEAKVEWEISSEWENLTFKFTGLIKRLRQDLSMLLVWIQPSKRLQNS